MDDLTLDQATEIIATKDLQSIDKDTVAAVNRAMDAASKNQPVTSEARKEIDAIRNDPQNPMYQKRKQGDKKVLAHLDELYQKEQEELTEKSLQPGKDGTGDDAAYKEEKTICVEELRQRWGEGYEQKGKAVVEAKDFLFDLSHETDKEAFGIFDDFFGNDPEAIDLLAGLRERLAGVIGRPSAPGSGNLTPAAKDALLRRTTGFLLDWKTDTRLARKLFTISESNPEVMGWVLRVGQKLYGADFKS